MGYLHVTKLTSKKDKANYIYQLTQDINALELMLSENMIETAPIRIGAEQEFCITTDEFLPNTNSLELLEEINDPHFTTEIGVFNLEINSDPLELKNDCFSKLHQQLNDLLKKAHLAAGEQQTKIVLTGILPTLSLKHIKLDHMTPIQRYYVLNEAIKESRKQDFNFHIKGVDELNLLNDSVMLEACNTSFQMHLQIHPNDFIHSYNWAQAISGPVLSVCANSPLLFGKELWKETRIALFTQSVDTRANSFLLNERQSRVSFGAHWETGTAVDIFKDNISRFRSLITSTYDRDSVEMVKSGEVPKLMALQLHNGTVYRWNRVCYGIGNGKPHLRIECRYIPSGPSVADEIANMAFWVGLMTGRPKKYDNIHEKWDFKDAKINFFRAARQGMATQFNWDNEIIACQDLILKELLPIAYSGLRRMNVSTIDIEYYLKIIENRVLHRNGSQWMVLSYRNLLKQHKPYAASQILAATIYNKQMRDFPVASWKLIESESEMSFKSANTVKHFMTTSIFTVDASDSLQLVYNIMVWKKINHVPVINTKKELVGILSIKDISPENLNTTVDKIMRKQVVTISESDTIKRAKQLFTTHKISSLPVVQEKRLLGILTTNDI